MSNDRNKQYARLVTTAAILTFVSVFLFNPFITVPSVSAGTAAARWVGVNIPAEGDEGGWSLAYGSDIRHLTPAADGSFYAYGAGLPYTLLKSTDRGLTWSHIGKVQDTITGIAVSPYSAGTIYYATVSSVYRSTDGGKSFIGLPAIPAGPGADNIEITSIAAGWLYGNILAVAARDADTGEYGGVYIYDESTVIPSWTDSGIGPYDVYGVAFSPGYASDRLLTAVATDETDTYVFSKTGNAGWNTIIGAARLDRDNSGTPEPVKIAGPAVIAFPNNYTIETGAPECCFYAGINTGTGHGDVYKITCADAPFNSTATDLNIGGVYGAGNTDITGLAVFADAGRTILLAGDAGGNRTYFSADSGNTWKRSSKSPTGDSDIYVIFSPGFGADGLMYAASSGGGSALSVSRDEGVNWDQVSLIDMRIDTILEIAPSPEYDRDNTLFMVTYGGIAGSAGLWRTINGGLSWEMTLSGFHPGVETISRAGLPPQYGAGCRTVFAAGESYGSPVIWESGDGGERFRARPTRDPVTGDTFQIDAWRIVDENTLFIAGYDGAHGLIYRSDNGGFSFTGGTPAGTNSIYSISLSPDYLNDGTILAGNSNGKVYKSTDRGASFLPLPAATESGELSACIGVAFDPGFKDNGFIYACSSNVDGGFYRFNTGINAYWETIDGTLPENAAIVDLTISGGGVLYGSNSAIGGGMERCLNPGSISPAFETIARGLSAGVRLSGVRQVGNRLWAVDNTDCGIMTYEDTLTLPVVQVSPENGASGIGSLTGHTVKNVTLDWEEMEGATGYEWQCTYNTDFSSIPDGFSGTVAAGSAHLPPLDPATVYYWRVRVSAPSLSPWSPKRSFTTSLGTEVVSLKPESPAAGAFDVPVKPIFQWTAVVGASSYELLIATDADFENPVIIKINEYSLPANAWECDVSLAYDTTYYWKVRAVTASTHSVWSSAGVFTTLPAVPADVMPPGETPEVRLLDGQDRMMMFSPPKTINPPLPTASSVLPPPAPATTPSAGQTPAPGQFTVVPGWIIYLIGGLVAIVMLALVIVLAVVLKIKRF